MKGGSTPRITQAKAYFAILGEITTRSQFGGYGLLADGIMFAVIAENELYLRATDHLEPLFLARGMVKMTYLKRGMPMVMRYYWVDGSLWQEPKTLLAFAWQAFHDASRELKLKKRGRDRLKDLPNIDASMERLLWMAGIHNSYELRLLGAKGCYLKLSKLNKGLGVKVLIALAGAIAGYHHAALPKQQRETLTLWFNETVAPECTEADSIKRPFNRSFNN